MNLAEHDGCRIVAIFPLVGADYSPTCTEYAIAFTDDGEWDENNECITPARFYAARVQTSGHEMHRTEWSTMNGAIVRASHYVGHTLTTRTAPGKEIPA